MDCTLPNQTPVMINIYLDAAFQKLPKESTLKPGHSKILYTLKSLIKLTQSILYIEEDNPEQITEEINRMRLLLNRITVINNN